MDRLKQIIRSISYHLRLAIGKVRCRIKGHDFGPVVFISPALLTYCRHCGEEIMGRTIDDLEPMTEADFEHLETLNMLDWEEDR